RRPRWRRRAVNRHRPMVGRRRGGGRDRKAGGKQDRGKRREGGRTRHAPWFPRNRGGGKTPRPPDQRRPLCAGGTAARRCAGLALHLSAKSPPSASRRGGL